MSDVENELEKAVKSCNDGENPDVAREVAKFYYILTKLPEKIRRGLQCFIYYHPITEPLKKDSPDDYPLTKPLSTDFLDDEHD
jgi:hypothetical protein